MYRLRLSLVIKPRHDSVLAHYAMSACASASCDLQSLFFLTADLSLVDVANTFPLTGWHCLFILLLTIIFVHPSICYT